MDALSIGCVDLYLRKGLCIEIFTLRCQGTKAIIHPDRVWRVDVYGRNISIVKFLEHFESLHPYTVKYLYGTCINGVHGIHLRPV